MSKSTKEITENTKKVRVVLELEGKDLENFERIVSQTGIKIRSELLRKALSVYGFLLNEKVAEGKDLFVGEGKNVSQRSNLTKVILL